MNGTSLYYESNLAATLWLSSYPTPSPISDWPDLPSPDLGPLSPGRVCPSRCQPPALGASEPRQGLPFTLSATRTWGVRAQAGLCPSPCQPPALGASEPRQGLRLTLSATPTWGLRAQAGSAPHLVSHPHLGHLCPGRVCASPCQPGPRCGLCHHCWPR